MKKAILFIIIVHASVTSIFAQAKTPAELENQLRGKKNFYEVKKTISNYYKNKASTTNTIAGKKVLQKEIKFLNRSLFDAESRLNEKGEIENVNKRIFSYLQSHSSIQSRSAAVSSAGDWRLVGPTFVFEGIGRVNRIAFHPTNRNIFYAGTAAGGLFKSTNGTGWDNVSSFIPSLGISGIVVSHDDGNTIYILTGDGDAHSNGGFIAQFGYVRFSVGVLKSTDGGASWHQTDTFPNVPANYTGLKLIQDPNNAQVLLAATSHGMFKTTNGGNTWTLCNVNGDGTADSGDNTFVYDVEYRPGSSNTVYCALRQNPTERSTGAFRVSNDGGVNFTTNPVYNPNSFTDVQRISIAVTPAAPDNVYLLAGPGSKSANSYRGLWLSTNNGQNFTRMSSSPNILGAPDVDLSNQNLYDLALAVPPASANVVVTGGLVIFKSNSYGTIFGQATEYFGDFVHPDIHDLVYNPLNGYLYAATDGGVNISVDNGSTWTRYSDGLSCTQFYHFGLQDDGGDIWGGAQDNGILIKIGNGSNFDHYRGGDGYDVLTDMAPAGNQDDKYFSVNATVYADGIADDIDITPDNIDQGDFDNYFPNLAMHPTNEDIIYAGYPQLYISYNRGSDWSRFAPPSGPGFVPGDWCISTCPSNGERLYTAGNNSSSNRGLYRIDKINNVLPDEVTDLTAALNAEGYPFGTKITDIAVQPNNSNRVWVTVGGFSAGNKVFFSSDGGNSWHNMSGSLPDLPTNCILTDNSGNTYVGTDIGVYYRNNSMADWTPFFNGLPRVPVTELEFLAINGTNLSIYASTFGRGIWASLVYSNCPSSLTVNENLRGQKFYEAGATLNSSSLIDGTAGTEVFFKSGSTIILKPGFEAKSGTELNSYIAPCGQGGIPSIPSPTPEETEGSAADANKKIRKPKMWKLQKGSLKKSKKNND